MKRILIFLIFFSFFSSTYAITNYIDESGMKNCSEDPVLDDASGKKWIVSTIDLSAPTTGSFLCEEHGYWSGTWSTWRLQNTHYNCPSNGYASQIECRNGGAPVACTSDGSGWTEYRVFCKTVDDTPPTILDTVLNPVDDTYIPANNARNIQISINPNGGSPTGLIQARMEDRANPAWFTPSITQNNTNTFSSSFNISTVDGSDRNANNYRPYTFQLQQVCDEAGNCLAGTPYTYEYNVYASTINIPSSTISIPSGLTSGTAVADGSSKIFTFAPKDIYTNDIVPVRRGDTTLLRAINFVFNHSSHDLRMNQYNLSSNAGGVEFEYNSASQQPNIGDTSTTVSESSVANNSWLYTVNMKVYVPTQNQYPKATWNFTLNNIQFDTSDLPAIPLDSTSREFKFKPLYETIFSWELVTNGFIEWSIQSSTTQITKNSWQTVVNPRLYLEFWSGALKEISPSFDLDFWKNIPPASTAVEWQRSSLSALAPVYHTLWGNESINLYTLLRQVTPSSPWVSYLASHVQYQVNGKTVSYSSDVIGKANYHDIIATGTTSTVLKWVKVLWLTSSDKTNEIVTNQFSDDIRIIGKVVKSSYRRDISQKVFETLRSIGDWSGTNLDVADLGWTSWNIGALNTGIWILNNTVQVFKNIGWKYVEISADTIWWQKTVVVIGGDIYITGDISSSANAILGIIALKDASWNWGNVYIHSNVRDIHAVIYADKSIMSAIDTSINGIIEASEIHGPSTPISTLANQLYIKGSLFSENTIGGSRANPVECPYYVDCITPSEAQQYDLNYIRRYTRIDTNADTIPDTIANGGLASSGAGTVYPDYPIIIDYNSALQTDPPPFFY